MAREDDFGRGQCSVIGDVDEAANVGEQHFVTLFDRQVVANITIFRYACTSPH